LQFEGIAPAGGEVFRTGLPIVEAGFQITSPSALVPFHGFVDADSSTRNTNGTDVLVLGNAAPFVLSRLDGDTFDLISFQATNLNPGSNYPCFDGSSFEFSVTGVFPGGSTITQAPLCYTKNAFITFTLPATFRGLASIRINTPISLDSVFDNFLLEFVDHDNDDDLVLDTIDNCPEAANNDQSDSDNDGLGDACDGDADADDVPNEADNCPLIGNPDQADLDGDGAGDTCDNDKDGDGIQNSADNCPETPNADQADMDGDGLGDACVGPAIVTPPGTGVMVMPVVTLPDGTTTTAVELTFDSVQTSGTTTVSAGSTPSGGATGSPPGFKVGTPPVYYDVTTTAGFTGPVTLCFSWQEGQFRNEANIKLFHFQNGAWVNVTTALTTDANKVCGEVNTLSPFALFEKAYTFAGFFQPVDNPPTRNVAKAGSAVPIKFSLNGDHGLDIFAAGYPASQSMVCSSGTASDAVEETIAAGTSGLSYDAATDQYTYVWKNQKAWAQTCRRLVLKLNDGSEHTADFGFQK
jgi:hypothetical protein